MTIIGIMILFIKLVAAHVVWNWVCFYWAVSNGRPFSAAKGEGYPVEKRNACKSRNEWLILLMEKILHHLGCKKSCK